MIQRAEKGCATGHAALPTGSSKNPNTPAVKREAEEDWGGDMRAQPRFLKGPKLSQIKRDHA